MEFSDDIVLTILSFLRDHEAYGLLSFQYGEIPGGYSDQQIDFHLRYCRDNGFVEGQLSGDGIMAIVLLTPDGLRHLQSVESMTPQSRISKSTAIDLLTVTADAIPELRGKSTDSPEFLEWKRDAEVTISYVFGDGGRHPKDFENINYHPYMIQIHGDNSERSHDAFLAGLSRAESVLKSMIREIRKFWVEDEPNHSDPTPSVKIFKVTTNSIFKENEFTVNEDLVFMLSPFEDPFDTIFTNHIKPTVEHIRNLNCVRADDIYDNQAVIEDIWRLTNEAKIIIAELTTKNANVFYETGLAHAIGKEVIPITQSRDDVPFDLRHRRYIFYKNTHEGIEQLKDDLTNTITSILDRTEQAQDPDPILVDDRDSASTNANSVRASWDAMNISPPPQNIDPDSRFAVIQLCDRMTKAIDSLARSNRHTFESTPTNQRQKIENLLEADVIDHQLASISHDLIGSRNAIAHGEVITIHSENLRQFIAATERIESMVLSKWK